MTNKIKTVPTINNHLETQILCAYRNLSNSWQIIKIINLPDLYWEKTLLPGQYVVFKASIKAHLEVFSAQNITTVLSDTIPCYKLKVKSASSIV